MANIKVSELNEATTINDEDLLMVVQGNENKKVSIETLMQEITNLKTITFNNEWMTCQKLYGGGVLLQVPIINPNNIRPTLNLTSSQIFIDGNWQNIPIYLTGIQSFNKTFCYLRFDDSSLQLTAGNSYLLRIIGSITIGE